MSICSSWHPSFIKSCLQVGKGKGEAQGCEVSTEPRFVHCMLLESILGCFASGESLFPPAFCNLHITRVTFPVHSCHRMPHSYLMHKFAGLSLHFLLRKDTLALMGIACQSSARTIGDKLHKTVKISLKNAKERHNGKHTPRQTTRLCRLEVGGGSSQLWRHRVGNTVYHSAAPFLLLIAFSSLKSVFANQSAPFLLAPRQ